MLETQQILQDRINRAVPEKISFIKDTPPMVGM